MKTCSFLLAWQRGRFSWKTLTWSSDRISLWADRRRCPRWGPSPGSGWGWRSAGNEVVKRSSIPWGLLNIRVRVSLRCQIIRGNIFTCIWSGCTVKNPWEEEENQKHYYVQLIYLASITQHRRILDRVAVRKEQGAMGHLRERDADNPAVLLFIYF